MTAYPKTYAAQQAAIAERACGYCGAEPGEHCRARSGFGTGHSVSVAQTHKSRLNSPEPESELKPFKIARLPLPHKLKHRVRAHGYVWCDHHGGIHDASIDSYGEGATECKPINWRRVYVETDDKSETF